MKKICVFLCVSVLVFSFIGESQADDPRKQNDDKVYIVYMGAAASSNNGAMRKDHAHLITSLMKRNRNALVHCYTKGFSGFSARLTEEEARTMAQKPGVVSVFPDPVLQLHTTRSWDFLELLTEKETSIANKKSVHAQTSPRGSNTIIGILDTGIWPESASFNDDGMGPIPRRWKGTCETGIDFNSSNCNRKIIGARYYKKPGSPRDHVGHGTHVSSTAAGSLVDGASYYDVATGTAKGGSPSSRIAMYQVCTPEDDCNGSHILKAFDDAISDGVDVLSLSLGGDFLDFMSDVVAIGAFHAMEKGIVVVCSAGNSGPTLRSVTNLAPWIFTVAASTVDRSFESRVIIGGNKIIKGVGIHFGQLKKTPEYPLVTGASAKAYNATRSKARECLPKSLNPAKVKGSIILCESNDPDFGYSSRAEEVERAGGVGIIKITNTDYEGLMAPQFKTIPGSMITENDAAQIYTYISSTKNPTATILQTVTTERYEPAPAIIFFSSRGPSIASANILKPDISAPGVDILAAWPDESEALPCKKPPGYYIISGTSMSCPHVSGIVAAVMAKNPTFSVSAIRSAIMTTALQTNNMDAPITNSDGSTATPYDFGAGEASPSTALEPGLVYETETGEYLIFLCAIGYNTSQIRLIASKLRKGFKCPANLTEDAISNINYPSIAISKLNEGESKTIKRTVTNVGDEESVYTASVEALTGVDIAVTPNKLVFTKEEKKLTYKVTFTAKSSPEEDIFGAITWTNGQYSVRSPIVISADGNMQIKG